MSKTLALAIVLVFLTASSIIVSIPVSGAATAENTWVSKAPMQQARSGLGVAVIVGTPFAETFEENLGNWSEVTKFTKQGTLFKTEPFTIDYPEWRIRWEYEPIISGDDHLTLHVYVYAQEFPGSWFESIRKNATEETNGTLYIHDRTGLFYLVIITAMPDYTIMIEQNLPAQSTPPTASPSPEYTPKTEPFPTVPVVGVSLTIGVIMVAVGLLVYHKKHKTKTA